MVCVLRYLDCKFCLQKIRKGDPITLPKRGEHAGNSLHVLCAKAYFQVNPQGLESKLPDLICIKPNEETCEYLIEWTDGKFPLGHIDKTAGGGKSNDHIYTVSLLRENNVLRSLIPAPSLSFRVLTFAVEAKKVLLRRGLTSNEIINYDSLTTRAYKTWVVAKLVALSLMSDTGSKVDISTFTPTLVNNKTRLLVSHYLRGHEIKGALTNLTRSFIEKLSSMARVNCLGQVGFPSIYDVDALSQLVDRYDIHLLLDNTWSGV